jgi:hypothetical protein
VGQVADVMPDLAQDFGQAAIGRQIGRQRLLEVGELPPQLALVDLRWRCFSFKTIAAAVIKPTARPR